MERLRDADGPRVQCSCPLVSKRLATYGDAIAPMVLHFVPPPVATALYVRAAYGDTRVLITYAGDCPSGADDSIDACLTSDGLLQTLADRNIVLAHQPTEFDAVLPPDRRRHYSEPGGVPARAALRQMSTPVDLVELHGDDIIVEAAQQLLASGRILIDLSAPLGCHCSGAIRGVSPAVARARVREQEPPRAASPVVDPALVPEIDASEPEWPATLADSFPARAAGVPFVEPGTERDSMPVAVESPARRRSPAGTIRPVPGATTVRRLEGRQLPRAFVARRRSSPRHGLRQSFMRATGHARIKLPSRWIWMAAAAAATVAAIALAFGYAR